MTGPVGPGIRYLDRRNQIFEEVNYSLELALQAQFCIRFSLRSGRAPDEYTHRLGQRETVARLRQIACLRVDAQGDDVIAVLVGGQDKFPLWIDGKAAWRAPSGGGVSE